MRIKLMFMKISTYIVFGLLVFLSFSCDRDGRNHNLRIGFSQAMSKDDWRRSMNDAMILQASMAPNINLTILDADYKIERQIEQIETFISDSVDLLIVSPIQSKPITPIVQKALNANIPVLVIDRKTENGTYTAYLGADNVDVGKNAAKEIIASKVKDTVRVLEIKGLSGSSPAEERSLGFKQIMESFKNVYIDTINGDWEKESIQDKFMKYLLDGNKVDFVFAHNDRMAKGAWEIAKELGVEKNIHFIGVDGLNTPTGGIRLVQDGILKATVLYPTGGDEAIKLAKKILNMEDVPKDNILSTTIINRVNAEIMQNQFDKINEQQDQIEEQLSAIRKQEDLYYSQNNLLKVTMALLAIIFSLALYSIYSIFTIRKKNRLLEVTNNKITIQRNQIEKIANQIKVSNEAKLNFFMGLSHEFKTPLTLILSATESIGDIAKEKGSKLRNEMELIYNNSNRLLKLINQLLDFRKLEDRKFTIKASKTNLYNFSKSIFNDFKREAKKRSIGFKLHSNNEDLEIYLDRNLMDKVYFNLFSNAFKFTPDNGNIEVSIIDNKSENIVRIFFKDSGIGIPERELKNVFQPFFKGSNNRKNSSGIGLHLSKEFIEMHKGSIEVRSYHGTEFEICLYKGSAHFDESALIEEPDLIDSTIMDFGTDNNEDDTYLLQTKSKEKETYSLLIIEDNRDLAVFLRNKLILEYNIHLSDGRDAIEKTLELIPDIVLCDINLPDKNGFEICRILKNDLRTSHIPVIILTALSNKESYLQGLEVGADLYLTKPFSFSILIQSIKSLLYNREKLRFYFTNNLYKIQDSSAFGNLEQIFMHNLNDSIHKNIENTDFTVEQLAESLNISRIQLYRKVKAMLGINISDYMANIRLEKAKAMLETSNLSISEIAYANGFSSPNYFSTSFKHKYAVTPGAYRRSL